jgi:transcriptional regulator with XRE-family HTH domain
MARRVADLDLRDYDTRIAVRAQLRAAREAQHLTQEQVAQAMWTQAANVRRLERQGVDQSYAVTVMRWAAAVNQQLVIEPVGFPPPAPRRAGTNPLLAAVSASLTGPDWQVVRLWQALVGIREACAVSQDQMARVLGISSQAVSLLEHAEAGSLLVVLQRHARAIAACCPHRAGAHLSVRVVPAPAPETGASA